MSFVTLIVLAVSLITSEKINISMKVTKTYVMFLLTPIALMIFLYNYNPLEKLTIVMEVTENKLMSSMTSIVTVVFWMEMMYHIVQVILPIIRFRRPPIQT
jgi:hypothetical protein